jgi:enoyl-CoA hydratase
MGSLDATMASLVEGITARSGPVTRLTKKAVRAGRDLPFSEALTDSQRIIKELLPVEDLEKGVAAFLEKRRPVWRHRVKS